MNSISAITLLIVDDEAEIRTGLRSIIPWEDYSVTVIGTAASGAEALDKIRYYEPNIVMDWSLSAGLGRNSLSAPSLS